MAGLALFLWDWMGGSSSLSTRQRAPTVRAGRTEEEAALHAAAPAFCVVQGSFSRPLLSHWDISSSSSFSFFTPPPLFCFAFLSPVPKRGRKRTHHARASREQRSAAAAAAGLGRAAGKSASGTFSGHFTRLRLSRSVPTRFAEFAVLVTPNTLRS